MARRRPGPAARDAGRPRGGGVRRRALLARHRAPGSTGNAVTSTAADEEEPDELWPRPDAASRSCRASRRWTAPSTGTASTPSTGPRRCRSTAPVSARSTGSPSSGSPRSTGSRRPTSTTSTARGAVGAVVRGDGGRRALRGRLGHGARRRRARRDDDRRPATRCRSWTPSGPATSGARCAGPWRPPSRRCNWRRHRSAVGRTVTAGARYDVRPARWVTIDATTGVALGGAGTHRDAMLARRSTLRGDPGLRQHPGGTGERYPRISRRERACERIDVTAPRRSADRAQRGRAMSEEIVPARSAARTRPGADDARPPARHPAARAVGAGADRGRGHDCRARRAPAGAGPRHRRGRGTDPAARARPDATHVETTSFPLIELAAPDLPWSYTPAAPAARGRLRPWLVLVVVEDGEGVGIRPRWAARYRCSGSDRLPCRPASCPTSPTRGAGRTSSPSPVRTWPGPWPTAAATSPPG